MAELMSLLRTVGQLKREAKSLRHAIGELTDTAAAARGEGLVRACVQCAEDIDLVRVSDAVLDALRGQLMKELLQYTLTRTQRHAAWMWVDKTTFYADQDAFVRDPANMKKILQSWANADSDSGYFNNAVHVPVVKHLLPLFRHALADHMLAKIFMQDYISFKDYRDGRNATADDFKKLVARIEDIRKAAAERIASGAAGVIERLVSTSPAIDKDIADKRKRLDEVEARLSAANEDLKNLMHAAGAEDAWETVFV